MQPLWPPQDTLIIALFSFIKYACLAFLASRDEVLKHTPNEYPQTLKITQIEFGWASILYLWGIQEAI